MKVDYQQDADWFTSGRFGDDRRKRVLPNGDLRDCDYRDVHYRSDAKSHAAKGGSGNVEGGDGGEIVPLTVPL